MHRSKQVSRLLVFGEVAKQGSFTDAAEALGISKSAVSQQVRALEEDLSVQLIIRTTRGLTLTAIGEKILVRSQMIQEQVNYAFTDLVDAQHNPKGPFNITYPHSIENAVVLPAMRKLCREYPGLEPGLNVSDCQIDLVKNNIDLAIRGGELQDSGFKALPLAKITEIFCATPLYLQKHRKTAKNFSLRDLQQHPWISSSWQKSTMSVLNLKSQQSHTIKLNPFAKTSTLPTALNMALNHMGIVSLPDISAIPYLRSGELVHVASDLYGKVWPLYVVHTYQNEKPVHVSRFYELLKQLFANQSVYSAGMTFAFESVIKR
ncbi:LysR family transcriptional regulator [Vibrio breoganii]|uniref:LysR family transcriptional regulator n=1 Tax=Vibrio breoganii TaxID=553239 RepID=UPI000C83FD5C|nr:LysR family transcriptional regulator [Vibrio breoganii]PMK26953.1 LysR family transcriptional regulator [Vibrio breoganii]